MKARLFAFLLVAFAAFSFAGCHTHNATFIDPFADQDVDTPLAPGEFGLVKLDPKDYPDMRMAWSDRAGLERAIDKSIQYLNAPSSIHGFPSGPNDPITHDQVLATLLDIKRMLHDPAITADRFQQEVLARYEVWTSKGYNHKGDVWFTGYYTPIYQGSPTPTSEFKYPIYGRPADLVSDPFTGDVQGTYPTRRELLQSGKLNGLEIMYFRKPIEPFIIQVQGSAKVILPNGQEMLLGFAGTNGREHRGLGSELVKEGKIDKKHLSLPTVLAYFDAHPGELDEYVMRDDRFTFLKPYGAGEWPSGSLGVQVTEHRSLATDKKIFPRASFTFIDVPKPTADGNTVPYKGFVLDQDTGGAIRAAGRADIYMGIGPEAGKLAGREFAQGRLFYIFIKPEFAQVSHPNLTKAPAKGAAPAKSGAPAAGGPTMPAKAGDSEMFPGAVKKN